MVHDSWSGIVDVDSGIDQFFLCGTTEYHGECSFDTFHGSYVPGDSTQSNAVGDYSTDAATKMAAAGVVYCRLVAIDRAGNTATIWSAAKHILDGSYPVASASITTSPTTKVPPDVWRHSSEGPVSLVGVSWTYQPLTEQYLNYVEVQLFNVDTTPISAVVRGPNRECVAKFGTGQHTTVQAAPRVCVLPSPTIYVIAPLRGIAVVRLPCLRLRRSCS